MMHKIKELFTGTEYCRTGDTFILSPAEIVTLQKAAQKHPLTIRQTDLGKAIALTMRRACPVSGKEWSKFMTVLLKPGEGVPRHQHKRHTILYYPEACTPVFVAGYQVQPYRGMILYIHPEVEHRVEPVAESRLSVAMLVDD